MVTAVAVLIVAALAFAAGHFVATKSADSLRAQMAERIADRAQALSLAWDRINHLELTIDEIRARELETTPPVPPDGPKPLTIPEEVQAELDQIEDDDGRDEFTAQVLLVMQQYPELEPKAIIAKVFG